MKPLTEEEFKAALPAQVKKSVTSELMDQINHTLSNPDTLEVFRENLISFASVMKDGRFKLSSYINAVKYVSFKLLGDTNINAYIKTFPEKYKRFIEEDVAKKDIASYSTAYNKSKLVILLSEQTMVPMWVVNAPTYQKAINVQAELMLTAKSEMVRSNAANSLMLHLKPPETTKIQLDIGIEQGSIIDDYQAVMVRMARAQQKLIAEGGDIKQIANASIKKPNEEIIDI